jgi:hypothetical protein
MKRIAEALGVSRSNLVKRHEGWTTARGPYVKAEDEALLPLIRRIVDARPTYGYRRIAALVNRDLARQNLPPANRKRVHRIMQRHSLLLQRHTGRREGRTHDGNVMVMRDDAEPDVLAYMTFPNEHRPKLLLDKSDRASQWRDQAADRGRRHLSQ